MENEKRSETQKCFYSQKEICEILGITSSTFIKERINEKLPCYQIGRRRKYRIDDLEKLRVGYEDKPVSDWVSVSDKLPDPETMCVVIFPDKYGNRWVDLSYYTGGKFEYYSGEPRITHWIELPELPQKDREENRGMPEE